MNLLEQYIDNLINRFLFEETAVEQFSLENLKNIKDFGRIKKYIETNLGKSIGEGQGRSVYAIDKYKVIKLAKNSGGIAQNNAEATVCKTDKYQDLFPVIFDQEETFVWIVVEKAEPLKRVYFEKESGMPWSEFILALGGAFISKIDANQVKIGLLQDMLQKHYDNHFLRRIIAVIKECGYEPGDFVKLDTWGVISNRVVIVDSGFTQSVYQQHYAESDFN